MTINHMAKANKHEEIPASVADPTLENFDESEEKVVDYGEIMAAWDFPEFVKYQRSRSWYMFFSIAIVALMIYAYIAKNWLFAGFIVIALIVYIVSESRPPLYMRAMLAEDGVVINKKLIHYNDLKNFYILYYPPHVKNLYLQPRNGLRPEIIVPLENQNPVIVRQILLQFLPEDLTKEELPISDSLSRMLKL